MSLGPAEILVIFVVALLVFGPTRLPEVGRQVGRGMRELRKFQQTLKGDLDDVLGDDLGKESNATSTPAPPEPAPTLSPKDLAGTDPGTPAVSEVPSDAASAVTPDAAAESAATAEPPPTSAPA